MRNYLQTLDRGSGSPSCSKALERPEYRGYDSAGIASSVKRPAGRRPRLGWAIFENLKEAAGQKRDRTPRPTGSGTVLAKRWRRSLRAKSHTCWPVVMEHELSILSSTCIVEVIVSSVMGFLPKRPHVRVEDRR